MRELVIGDIHGALRGLKECLTKAKYNPIEDKLIFLGDYVDGWSEVSELIQYLIDLDKKAVYKSIFIRGNHDEWASQWIIFGMAPNGWMEQGGSATYDSYLKTGYLVEESHKQFFRNLHNYYVDDKNRGFVHGGFKSRLGLGHDHYQSDYYWDRDLWSIAMLQHGKDYEEPLVNMKLNPDKVGASSGNRFRQHHEVYIGHTATNNWRCKNHYPESKIVKTGTPITIPMNRCNVWNMDTGAGFNGKLTIMDINTKEYWQSDHSDLLYPEEKGR